MTDSSTVIPAVPALVNQDKAIGKCTMVGCGGTIMSGEGCASGPYCDNPRCPSKSHY
ncbi:hypothetical protein BGZ76_004066 [Entomortierella beljakovae]|nr:hypothetical protein BGZ76_004066 [Entomortierella beljakovae]